ncbi:hypothetical protein [Helicobacter cetorum]|uniref:Uncharacterized protein n=1 Tax=Helicobacter cetorum (strain ATCC BAA-540 / CCUG 52418 / MIT 99-5656) TaxID=1163745 RepID=I0ES46_HELCM|nr:hypothetical protein [Helicobacter cetorum]AFI05765.1 hypothetical protein HCD_03745 [Helicobacter cetorum MIT 99-5656]
MHPSLRRNYLYSLLLGCLCFYFYSLLRDLIPYLPPMLGFLFLLYARVCEKFLATLGVFLCLFLFESMHLKTLGVLALLFLIYHQLIYKNSLRFFHNGFFFKVLHVFLIYYLFLSHFVSNSLSLNLLGLLVVFTLIESVLWSVYEKSSL